MPPEIHGTGTKQVQVLDLRHQIGPEIHVQPIGLQQRIDDGVSAFGLQQERCDAEADIEIE